MTTGLISDSPELSMVVMLAAGVLARMAGAVGLSTLPVFPGLSLRIRAALLAALSAVAIPAAISTAPLSDGFTSVSLPLFLGGELLVGFAIGTSVAIVLSASAWAGGILGSVSGLAWADDFDPHSDAQTAGIARLAWWIGLSAFLAAGGQLGVVAGLIDSVHSVPIGQLALNPNRLPDLFQFWAVEIPGLCLSLAVTLAMPSLMAVMAFHLASAICMRTIAFMPGHGLLQAAAAVVLLGAIYVGVDAWAGGFGTLVEGPIEACFTPR